MHVGGWHILMGLLFLVCCMGVTVFYVNVAYALGVAIRKGLYRFKYHWAYFKYYLAQNNWIEGGGQHPDEFLKPPQLTYLNRKFFFRSIMLILVLFATVYGNQRITWMSDANKRYEAKEYWVSGQVVFAHRRLMEYVFHPENVLARPYTFIQKKIYDRGIAILPENDGERHVWQNAWFLYLYTRKIHRPYFVKSVAYEPKMVALLDRCWETMQGMAEQPIADPAMSRKSLIEFPTLASYYTLFQGHYTGKYELSARVVRKTPHLVERHQVILNWLDELKMTWERTGFIRELKGSYPEVLAYWQGNILSLVQDLSLTIALNGEFYCDHPMIERLYREYEDAMSKDPNRSFFLLYSKKNLRQARIIYRSSVYEACGGASKYLLTYLCDIPMPTETYTVVKRYQAHCDFLSRTSTELLFKDELKGLKGKKHE